jgi:DNA-directed RNA polymerase specialized sigma24 family protein
MTDLDRYLGPEVVAAIEKLVEERVAAALETRAVDDGPEWLTLAQAADHLGCSVDAVRMRAKRGRLVTRTHGRRLYVSAGSVRSLQ